MINELHNERNIQRKLRGIKTGAENDNQPVHQPRSGQMRINDAALAKQVEMVISIFWKQMRD